MIGPFRLKRVVIKAVLVVSAILTVDALPCVVAGAPTGRWIPHRLQDTLSEQRYLDVGENCLIYACAEDTLIYAFSVHAGRWSTLRVMPAPSWTVGASGDVAIAYHDSMIVAYSAAANAFASLVAGQEGVGEFLYSRCRGQVIMVLTDRQVLAFDAEDGLWREHTFPEPVSGDGLQYSIHGAEHYSMVSVISEPGIRTTVAYSAYTKSFSDYIDYNYSFLPLLDGFMFYRTYPLDPPHFIGGYSAITGATDVMWVIDYHKNLTQMMRNRLGYCHAFTNSVGTLCNMYAFDTRWGSLRDTSFGYSHECGGSCLMSSFSAGDFSFQGKWDMPGSDLFIAVLYSGISDSFLSLTTPLARSACSYGLPWPAAGENILAGADCNTIMFYDAAGNQMATAVRPPPDTSTFYYLSTWFGDGWAVARNWQPNSDSVCYYTYNSRGNSLRSNCRPVRILKSLGGENIAGFVIKTANSDESLEIYSPGTDSWSSCSVDAATFWPDVRRDFISYYDLAAQGMRLFDGVTGVEVQLPGGQIDNEYSQDDFQIYHQYDGNWVGYSTHTRSVSEFPGDRYPYISADGSVVLMHDFLNQPRYYVLTYNALYGCFVPLTLTEEQGHCVDILPGGRTALLLTKNGCLFAFDPHRSQSDCCVDRVGNVDCDSQDNADIADVQAIVRHLYLTLEPFCCPEEADLDYSGTIDIGDLTMLITSLYISLEPLDSCP